MLEEPNSCVICYNWRGIGEWSKRMKKGKNKEIISFLVSSSNLLISHLKRIILHQSVWRWSIAISSLITALELYDLYKTRSIRSLRSWDSKKPWCLWLPYLTTRYLELQMIMLCSTEMHYKLQIFVWMCSRTPWMWAKWSIYCKKIL